MPSKISQVHGSEAAPFSKRRLTFEWLRFDWVKHLKVPRIEIESLDRAFENVIVYQTNPEWSHEYHTKPWFMGGKY